MISISHKYGNVNRNCDIYVTFVELHNSSEIIPQKLCICDKYSTFLTISQTDRSTSNCKLTALKLETLINWLKSNTDIYSVRYSNNIYENGKRVRGFGGISLNM